MLSKILFAMMLTTSVVQVQALQAPSVEINETVTAPSRQEMAKAIYDVFYKDSEMASVQISVVGSPSSMPSLLNTIIEDKFKRKVAEVSFAGYAKAFDQLTDEVMKEFYALATDSTVLAFIKDLRKNTEKFPLDGGFTHMSKTPTLPSTVTLSHLIKHLGSIQKHYQSSEKEILEQAYETIKKSFGTSVISTEDLPTFLQKLFPHVEAGQLDIIGEEAKKNFCSDHEGFHGEVLGVRLTPKFGHILWDGKLSKESWDDITLGKMLDKLSGLMGKLNPLFGMMRNLSDSPQGPKINKLSQDQENNVFLGTVVTLHQLLEENHKEGFLRYEDFFKTHSTQLKGLESFAHFFNKEEVKNQSSAIKESILKDLSSPKSSSSSPTGEVCKDCGKVHGSSGAPSKFPSFEEFMANTGGTDFFSKMMMDDLGSKEEPTEKSPPQETKSDSKDKLNTKSRSLFSFLFDDSSDSDDEEEKATPETSPAPTSSSSKEDKEVSSDSESIDIKPLFDSEQEAEGQQESVGSNESAGDYVESGDDDYEGSGNDSAHGSGEEDDGSISDDDSGEESSDSSEEKNSTEVKPWP